VKKLIVNADDLGLSENVDLGITRAHTDGIVTSATLLACGNSAAHGAALALENPSLGIGVHLCLTRERPVLDPARLRTITSGGRFYAGPGGLMTRLYLGMADRKEIKSEFTAQLERAVSLGIKPTHLDGHQHVHILPGVLPVTLSVAREFGITSVRYPVGPAVGPHGFGVRVEKFILETLAHSRKRYLNRMDMRHPGRLYGLAETGSLGGDTVEDVIRSLPDGVSELMCHPGMPDDRLAAATGWGYGWGRELDAVTLPGLRELAAKCEVELTNYANL